MTTQTLSNQEVTLFIEFWINNPPAFPKGLYDPDPEYLLGEITEKDKAIYRKRQKRKNK